MSLQGLVAQLPHLPDDTLAIATQGYAFIGNRCRAAGADVFETRILLQRTICMLGAEAARVFYDRERIGREGAAPLRVQATLFGRGGVQGLDGDAHLARKHLLLERLTPGEIARLRDLFEAGLVAALARWPERIVLFDEVQDVLCRAVCTWAGVTIDEDRRIRDIAAMIDGSGGAGPRHWRARVGRARAEWWIEKQVEQVRAGKVTATGALDAFARSDLDARTAAVDLLNLIRPTVAIARYVVFAALALHEYPHTGDLLADDALLVPFVHEVRRFYPFFPAVAGRVVQPFSWHGVDFTIGTRVLLDLYGTNHDARTWTDPEEFRPERFVGWNGDPFTLIPQGGGDVTTGHRCAGETVTIELLKVATRFLVRSTSYEVPPQDLTVSLARIPTMPASRFVMSNPKPIRR